MFPMSAEGYLNTARFALANPRRGLVMVRKVLTRVTDPRAYREHRESLAWLASEAQDPATVAQSIAPELWNEALEFGAGLRERAVPILERIGQDMGGGGDYEFLYWLTRLRRPEVVVETGVAAGWTSQAFLAALARNGVGRLYSSDFPLFRNQNPETAIGCLVEPALRANWELCSDGDAINLPLILARVSHVDLVHYDSDKSYSGRDFAVRLLRPSLAPDGLIVMDDLHNNSWFHDDISRASGPYTILGEGGRYGVLGELRSDGNGPRAGELGSEFCQDRQVGVELDAIKSTDSERE